MDIMSTSSLRSNIIAMNPVYEKNPKASQKNMSSLFNSEKCSFFQKKKNFNHLQTVQTEECLPQVF